MSTFLQTDAGLAAVFSAAATIAAVVIGQWLRGKVNLITFSPNSTYFQLKPAEANQQPVHIRSGQIMIQNLGRQPARNVQVTSVPGGPPAGYVILPSIVHSTRVGANNEWIVEIPFIAPKETITLQVLNGQLIDSVRSEGGAARAVPVVHQRMYPKWVNFILGALLLWGLLCFFYVVGRLLLKDL